jgi:hypothetical protein
MKHDSWRQEITLGSWQSGKNTMTLCNWRSHMRVCLALISVLLTSSVCLARRDLERLDKPVFQVKGHQSIINAIDGVGGLNIGYGAPEIVTGSRDGQCCTTPGSEMCSLQSSLIEAVSITLLPIRLRENMGHSAKGTSGK